MPAFAAVIAGGHRCSRCRCSPAACCCIGFGAGLFGHGTLTATMNRAPKEQTGLALGAWGAVQATAAGVAVALGGVLRDIVAALAAQGLFGAALAAAGDRLCFCLCAGDRACWS